MENLSGAKATITPMKENGKKGKGGGKGGKGGHRKGGTPGEEPTKQNCKEWMENQTCSYTSSGKVCRYEHPEINGWVLMKPGAKAKAKPAKGKGKGEGKGSKLCYWFFTGKCKLGDECPYSHNCPTIAPLDNFDTDKPKPKAKAKSKAAAEDTTPGNC